MNFQVSNHSFNIYVAADYGIEAAVIIQNFQFWLNKNLANKVHIHDGKVWTYNSAKAMAELFPYFNAKKIAYVINKLVDDGVLIKGNYNQSAYDRTCWYAFVDENKWLNRHAENENPFLKQDNPFPKSRNGLSKNGEPIPDINTDSKPNINTDSKPDIHAKPEKPKKKQSRKTSIPDKFIASEEVKDWYMQQGYQDPIENHLASFILKCQANGYQYINWDAAFKTAIRDDWARIRQQPFQQQTQQSKPMMQRPDYERYYRENMVAIDSTATEVPGEAM